MGSLRLKGCLLTAVFFSSCISLANMKFSIKKNTYLLFLGTRAFQGSERMLSWCDANASQKCGQRYTLQTHTGNYGKQWDEGTSQVRSWVVRPRSVLCCAVLLAAGLDHGAFMYEARALISGSKVQIGSLQYSRSVRMKIWGSGRWRLRALVT